MLFRSIPSLAAAVLLAHFALAAPAPASNSSGGNELHAPQALSSSSAAAGGYKNAAYYVNWAIYGRNYQPQQIPATKLTHVIYAFANIQTDGTV